ncbi:MAG: hypothetical protein KAW12_06075 [Candidatus Aminicenantes bacterium]|nr:hypothetical protein [Candidatus Aminicenantes bacterium]
MKKLSLAPVKILVMVIFFVGVFMAGISDQYAREIKKKEVPDKKIQKKIPGFRAMSTKALEAVAYNKTIKPREVLKGDHVACGVSLRNRGGGVINLRGAPEGAQAVKAYLYWDILANRAPRSARVSINGVSVQGKLIGQGPDPYWGRTHNFVYLAEVPLYLLYEGINGDYKVAGVAGSQGFGMNPWEYWSGAILAEGVSLVIVYLNQTNKNKVTYIYDQPVSSQMFCGAFGVNLVGFNAHQQRAKFTMLGADGQVGGGLNAFYFCSSETSFFQGYQIAGPAEPNPQPYHDADSDWNGHDGEPLNQLWDTRTHIVRIKKNSTSAKVLYKSKGDCLVIVAFILTM